MDVDTLAGLSSAFEAWRKQKRHVREAIPVELLERARAAARRHGPAAVARVAQVDRSRLFVKRRTERKEHGGSAAAKAVRVPSYSRVEVAAAALPTLRPFAEVETAAGLKVRLFTESGEALGVLASLLNAGGTR